MKKAFKIIALSLVLTLSVPTISNAQLFDQGDFILSFGLGVGAYYTGSAYRTTIPPIWAAGDYCLREDLGPGNLGVGGYLGYSGYRYDIPFFDDRIRYSRFIIGGRGTYHFTELVDKLDLYGGVLLGAEILSHDDVSGYNDYNSSGVAYSLFAGARYFFNDNIAVMGELGYGIAVLSFGISFKF